MQNEADNGLKNERGTLAMARTRDPHSATAQFFINLVDNDFLDHSQPTLDGWGYCVFGKVTEGMDVVDKIEKEKTTTRGIHSDVPVSAVITEDGIFCPQEKPGLPGGAPIPQRLLAAAAAAVVVLAAAVAPAAAAAAEEQDQNEDDPQTAVVIICAAHNQNPFSAQRIFAQPDPARCMDLTRSFPAGPDKRRRFRPSPYLMPQGERGFLRREAAGTHSKLTGRSSHGRSF